MPRKSEELALISVSDMVGYCPSIRATAEGAHGLTQAITALAHYALQEEWEAGSNIPPLLVQQVNRETGEFVDVLNLAYEAVLRERALTYLQSLKLEADASVLEILADIFERQLYLHHPDQWGSLGQFLTSMAVGKSVSYQSIIERLATVILPFLQVKELCSVRDMMELITEGGFSNLYFLLPEMLQAVESDDRAGMAELLNDAKSLPRREINKKYKAGKSRVPPAKATLTHTNPGWRLEIEMTDSQKAVILNTLGGKIKYE